MPLNSTIKTALEEVARPVWLLGADGQPMGVADNPLVVTGTVQAVTNVFPTRVGVDR